ncbi:MAG: hypothetical protein Q4E74_06115 [Ruminococcus sp.]|nr:hypothetical protein [Ruminococcus sp.]
MQIILNEKYSVRLSSQSLGYVGETNARTITFSGLETDGAQAYKMRFEYTDGVSYDVDITSGTYTVDGSLLRTAGKVQAQILAYSADGGNYELVKKSNVFELNIKPSLEGEPAPIPTYEQAAGALEKVLAAEKSSAENAEKSETAGNAAQAAQNAAETAKSEAEKSAESAVKAAENAAQSETAAKTSESNAAGNALRAETAAQSAETSANQAAQYKSEISEYMALLPQFSYDSETETLTITTAG